MSQAQPDGYLALPAGGTGNPVLVLHAWWGLNETVRAVCTRLAEAGFVAFAPDLYAGKVTDQIDEADRLSSTLFDERLGATRAIVTAAAAFLAQRAGQPDGALGMVGFSLGTFFALDLSVSVPDRVRAVVIYYGTRPGDYHASQAAYLGHFAESDDFEPQSEVDALEEALRQAGRPYDFYRYPGTGHWFAEPDRKEAFDPAAADLAWRRTLDFLGASFAR